MFRISDWSKRNLQSAVPIQDPAVCDSVRKCRPGVLETGTVVEYDGRHPQKVNQKKKEKENLHEYQYFNKRIKRTRSVELSDRGSDTRHMYRTMVHRHMYMTVLWQVQKASANVWNLSV